MGMSGQTAGQKTASQYTANAVGTLEDAAAEFMNNPNWGLAQGLAQSILSNPDILTQGMVTGLKANQASDASTAYEGALARTNERAAASGGFRGGDQRLQERLLASDLGNNIANANRSIDVQAAQINNQARRSAVDMGINLAQVPYGLRSNIANAYLGAASNPVWQQQNNAVGQMMGGIGSLAGMALAPSSAVGAGLGSRIS